MTKIQKVASIYIFAFIAVSLSFLLWTTLLAHRWEFEQMTGKNPIFLWNAKIRTEEQGKVLEVKHGAPPLMPLPSPLINFQQDVLDEGKIDPPEENQLNVPVLQGSVVPIPALEDDMTSWELSPRYTIDIPSLRILAPILLPSRRYWDAKEWDLLEEQMQVGLHNGAVAYPHSVRPGQNGALIIAGHSSPPDEQAKQSAFGSLFALVPTIKMGERIVVKTGDQEVEYEVIATTIVPASDTSILKQDEDESILKLITCYPVGTTRERFVVTARLVE